MSRVIHQYWIDCDPYPTNRANHGRPWSAAHQIILCAMWDDPNVANGTICTQLGRSRLAVAMEAVALGLADHDPVSQTYRSKKPMNPETTAIFDRNYRVGSAGIGLTGANNSFITNSFITNATTATQLGDPKMNIETKTYINGIDASNLTDSQIFSRIANIEQEIDKLKAIRTQSEKLAKTIAYLEADVTALAAYVDGR